MWHLYKTNNKSSKKKKEGNTTVWTRTRVSSAGLEKLTRKQNRYIYTNCIIYILYFARQTKHKKVYFS